MHSSELIPNQIYSYNFDIKFMQPRDVVLWHRTMSALCAQDGEDRGRASSPHEMVLEHLNEQLSGLPFEDEQPASTGLAKTILECFASSPVSEDRAVAVEHLDTLTYVDHDSGMSLWRRLVRDEDSRVRRRAHEEVGALATSRDDAEHFFSVDERLELVNSFLQAERGQGIYVLGHTAASAVLQATWDAPRPPFPKNRRKKVL